MERYGIIINRVKEHFMYEGTNVPSCLATWHKAFTIKEDAFAYIKAYTKDLPEGHWFEVHEEVVWYD